MPEASWYDVLRDGAWWLSFTKPCIVYELSGVCIFGEPQHVVMDTGRVTSEILLGRHPTDEQGTQPICYKKWPCDLCSLAHCGISVISLLALVIWHHMPGTRASQSWAGRIFHWCCLHLALLYIYHLCMKETWEYVSVHWQHYGWIASCAGCQWQTVLKGDISKPQLS